ncbi:MAG: response regulator transcription factor [Bdellovibrionales bacterium]|nr:response regulator transcription factor [Bdellovibrionales bacterium]
MFINAVIIEDEVLLASQMKILLEMQKFTVSSFNTAEDFIFCFSTFTAPTLYLIDLHLPGLSGSELVKLIRYKDKISSIFVISGDNDADEISECLKSGADDYLQKPYNPDHFMLKLVNTHNKMKVLLSTMLNVGVKLIPEANLIIRDGIKIKLTKREYGIIQQLLSKPEDIQSRENLVEAMIGNDITDRTIDVHVHSLRKKISKVKMTIETCRGQGYKVVVA